MNNIEDLIKQYVINNKKRIYALNNYLQLKNKRFNIKDALIAIFNATNGSSEKATMIIDTLTKKDKTFGRTQVYADKADIQNIDLIQNPDGTVALSNYNPLHVQKKSKFKFDNPNSAIYKNSGEKTKRYLDTTDKINDLGAVVKSLYPEYSNEEITRMLFYARQFSVINKIGVKKIIDSLVNGKLKFVQNAEGKFKLVSNYKTNTSENVKRVIFKNLNILSEAIKEANEEMTYFTFAHSVKTFLVDLLQNPTSAKPNLLLNAHKLNRSRLIELLIKFGIIEKDENIVDKDENGNPTTATMSVKYKIPKKNFSRKVRKLFIKLFEKNLPKKQNQDYRYSKLKDDISIMKNSPLTMGVVGGDPKFDSMANAINDELEDKVLKTEDMGDGATNASSSGQFSQPLFNVQRREIYNTKPNEEIEEATTTMNAGDYQYTVPFGGDKATLSRKNGKNGSISINRTK